jgi:conjugal transfer pilus assembly protein TraB
VVVEDSPDYLPPNSYAPAKVIVGVDASAGVASQTDPLPVVLRITGPARSVMQNGKVLTTRLQGCIVNGAARGDLSSEKVYVKLARMTCDQPGGRVAVSEVKGFISFAGKSGVRGRVVSREGSLVSQALLAGIVGGFGRGFSANANSVFSGVTTNADGTRSKLSAGDILGGGLGQGAADAADTVSKYLIERAEQYQPVVEMPTSIDVEIVFLDGVYVGTPNDPRRKQPNPEQAAALAATGGDRCCRHRPVRRDGLGRGQPRFPGPGARYGQGARRAQAAPAEDADRCDHLRWPWRPVRSRLEIDTVLC